MRINKVKLVNFRNYAKKDFEFGQKVLVMGENGSGKSNLMEAIYMLATGKSFRADKDEEMVSYNNQLSVVSCKLAAEKEEINLQIAINKYKHFEVNGVPRRMMDFAGRLKAVMFGPEDMELLTGSPSGRRKYLDLIITQTDREYRRCLLSYEKGLRQRNKLLDLIRDGVANRSQLYFWDRLLIKDGGYITEKREEYIEKLNSYSVSQFTSLYDKSVISEVRLKQYENEEVAAGATLVGPHRDDFIIAQAPDNTSPLHPSPNLGEGNLRDVSKYGSRGEPSFAKATEGQAGKDVSRFGSRGEQRMAVMWLKSNEIKYLTIDDQLPILLLDDVFSELDYKHRLEIETDIGDLIEKGGQVIMTTADENDMPAKDHWQTIKL